MWLTFAEKMMFSVNKSYHLTTKKDCLNFFETASFILIRKIAKKLISELLYSQKFYRFYLVFSQYILPFPSYPKKQPEPPHS